MPHESGEDSIVAPNIPDGLEQHSDRLAVDDALNSLLKKVIGSDPVEGMLEDLSDPEATEEIREHYLAEHLRSLLVEGILVGKELAAGNPSGDPDIETLKRFSPGLAGRVDPSFKTGRVDS